MKIGSINMGPLQIPQKDMETPAESKGPKGLLYGFCNVTRCQTAGAFFYNRGTRRYYCQTCARNIVRAHPPEANIFPFYDREVDALKIQGDMTLDEVRELMEIPSPPR